MEIALIIPYKNAEKWLKRCLDSIRGPFQVILIDDHSTDRSSEIVDSHPNADNFIHTCTCVSSGVSAARNIGIHHAVNDVKADYIAFLDADDELHPDAYQYMTEAIPEAPKGGIIQFNHLMIVDNAMPIMRMYNKKGTYLLDNLPKLWVSAVNKLYDADLIKHIQFPQYLKHGEDEIFNIRCLEKARSIYNSEKVTMIHHKDNPKSLSKSTTIDDLFCEQRHLIDELDNFREDKELCNAIRIRQAELWNNPCYKRVFGGEGK